MKLPYLSRIMGVLTVTTLNPLDPRNPIVTVHEPVEIARFKRRLAQADWDFFTREADSGWTFWAEEPLLDRQCLSTRPKPRRGIDEWTRIALNAAENAALQRTGLTAEYASQTG